MLRKHWTTHTPLFLRKTENRKLNNVQQPNLHLGWWFACEPRTGSRWCLELHLAPSHARKLFVQKHLRFYECTTYPNPQLASIFGILYMNMFKFENVHMRSFIFIILVKSYWTVKFSIALQSGHITHDLRDAKISLTLGLYNVPLLLFSKVNIGKSSWIYW